MADITAADVKKLRDATGAGMMDAKKALVEANGDFDKAGELLRIKGMGKVDERAAERTASNGLIAAAEGAMIELNCETDFVAKNEQFQQLAADIVAHASASKPADAAALLQETLSDGRTVSENIDSVAAVIREKLALGRVVVFDGQVAAYMHRRSSDLPPAVGVLVEFEGDNLDVARSTAMQIAAMRPRFVSRDEVPQDNIDNERRIAEEIARKEGKPEAALSRIIEGRLTGYFKEVALLDQPSVQDNKKSVGDVLKGAGVTVKRFARFEVGQA
jgi:elongation factor Ts